MFVIYILEKKKHGTSTGKGGQKRRT